MIKKILFEEKINVKTKVSHTEELWAEDINEIKEVVNNNADELSKGLKLTDPIPLTANQPHEYTLPQDADLYAIRISGAATVIVGSAAGEDDIIESTSQDARYLQFGFLTNTSVWLKSDTAVTVTPIIFQM